MLFLVLVYVGVGLFLAALSIPMMQRRVKPNPFYGFRVPKAYTSDAVWYEINAYSGKRLFVGGLAIAGAGIFFALVPGMNEGVYVGVITIVLLLTLGVGLAQSFWRLNQIAK